MLIKIGVLLAYGIICVGIGRYTVATPIKEFLRVGTAMVVLACMLIFAAVTSDNSFQSRLSELETTVNNGYDE